MESNLMAMAQPRNLIKVCRLPAYDRCDNDDPAS